MSLQQMVKGCGLLWKSALCLLLQLVGVCCPVWLVVQPKPEVSVGFHVLHSSTLQQDQQLSQPGHPNINQQLLCLGGDKQCPTNLLDSFSLPSLTYPTITIISISNSVFASSESLSCLFSTGAVDYSWGFLVHLELIITDKCST